METYGDSTLAIPRGLSSILCLGTNNRSHCRGRLQLRFRTTSLDDYDENCSGSNGSSDGSEAAHDDEEKEEPDSAYNSPNEGRDAKNELAFKQRHQQHVLACQLEDLEVELARISGLRSEIVRSEQRLNEERSSRGRCPLGVRDMRPPPPRSFK